MKYAKRKLLGLLFVLTGCSLTPTTSTVNCDVFGVITYYGDTDAPETIEKIRRHNAVYRAVCE